MKSKNGQVWVETVIYTLIGLSLMGLTLAILTPKIKEFRDRSIVEETLSSLNLFDSKINELLDAPGNKRRIDMALDKGIFSIDAENDSIRFLLQGAKVRYSEPGVSLEIGRVNVTTKLAGVDYDIKLEIRYKHNLTFEGAEEYREFTPVSIPYKFFIENKGISEGKYNISFSEGE
jgi:hypothetical protein